MNAANIFHMYFSYNHMFFPEYAFGYAAGNGEIEKNAHAVRAAQVMLQQMISLIHADPKFPEGFDTPLPRFVKKTIW